MNDLRDLIADLPPSPPCLACGNSFGSALDFLIGMGSLGGLIWLLYRLETDPGERVIEHVIGILVVGFVVFLFVRFAQ